MRKTILEPLHETLCDFVLESGLQVVIVPKIGFSRLNVSLQVAFGSIDLAYYDSQGNVSTFSEGIAHFLEHMIFENAENDVSKSFSMIGASINAYTTFNRTVYYFTTAKTIYSPLGMLLRTVFHPAYETHHIEKEKAIIASEIQMYQDDLEQSLYYDVMKRMYRRHSIATDIAGTQESIQAIDSKMLQRAFDVFYHPSNCLLFISGDVDPDAIYDYFLKEDFRLPNAFASPVDRIYSEEPPTIDSTSFSLKKDMKNNMVMVGLKMNTQHLSLREKALMELKMIMLMDNFFGKSSENYELLQKQKLINNTFDYSVSIESSFSHCLFFSETKNPQLLIKELRRMVIDVKNQPIDRLRFQIQKRKIIGQFVQIFNSPSEVSQLVLEYELKGLPLPELMSETDNMDIQDLDSLYPYIQESSLIDFYYHS